MLVHNLATPTSTTDKTPTPTSDRDAQQDCSEIMSLTISNNIESTGLANFESEACDKVEVLGQHWYHPKTAPLQPDIQNLTQYFARPRLIGSGTFTTSQNVQFVQTITPLNLFQTLFPFGSQRLTGVYGVRFKLVFTVQVATTPFHQGVLVANWQYGDTPTTASPNFGLTPRYAVLGMQTNVPNVRIDLAETTMATLSIPFLNHQEFLEVGAGGPLYGTFAICPILPVTSGAGTSPPTYRVYLHIEDMELIGAYAPDASVVVLQSGKKLSPVTEEFNRDSHPFSSALNSAGQAFSYLAKGIPSLASLAGPPAWFLGQAARLARFYGFSKPLLVEPPQRMYPQSHVNEANVDLPACNTMVAPFQGNTLAVSPEFAHTDVDEMSIPFIISQYSQICIGYIASSMASGTMLYATPFSPSCFWFRSRLTGSAPFCNIQAPLGSSLTTTAFVPSNLFFVGSVFRFWKGSVRFRVTFAKTKFHGGRVLAYFNPRSIGLGGAPTAALPSIEALVPGTNGPQPFGYSKLFDLRDSNVFEFDVPYISFNPYVPFFQDAGSFSFYVQDPLIAPDTVPSTVPFLVEVRALDDFEFAAPTTPNYPPANTTNLAPGVVYQSSKLITLAKPEDCTNCIGEKVTSIKQLISIPKGSQSVNLLPNVVYSLYVYPWWFGNRINTSTTALNAFPNECFGFGNYFSNAYVYVRGGTDFHAYLSNFSGSDAYISAALVSTAGGAVSGTPALSNNLPVSNNARVSQNLNGYGAHVRVPAYQRLVRLLSYGLGAQAWVPNPLQAVSRTPIPALNYNPNAVCQINIATTSTVNTQFRPTRCAADDAALGHYIGPPLLGLISNVSTSTTYDPDSVAL